MIIKKIKQQNYIFIVLLFTIFILIGFLGIRFNKQFDITQRKLNSLSEKTTTLLKQINKPLKITAFIRGNLEYKKVIVDVIDIYKQKNKFISLEFKNPDTDIDLIKKYNISQNGELYFQYNGKNSHSINISEIEIGKAISKLLYNKKQNITFITGHGERGLSKANFDYKDLVNNLSNENLSFIQQNTTATTTISNNTSLLVIADPRTKFSKSELKSIQKHIDDGGNTLFLVEKTSSNLGNILSNLSISLEKNIITNNSGVKYGIKNNKMLIIEPFSTYKPLKNIDAMLLFPETTEIKYLNKNNISNKFSARVILKTKQNKILGINLKRIKNDKVQRVVVISDADFLSNSYIGNGQNLLFSKQLFSFLSLPDFAFSIEKKSANKIVIIPEKTLFIMAFILIFIIPILIFLFGFWVRRIYRRKNA